MKKYLSLLCLIMQLLALEYIYMPAPVLFAGTMQNRQILLTTEHMYALSGRYYQQVYIFPEKITAVERSGDVLLTDKYRIDLTQGIQLTKNENKNIFPKPAKAVYSAAAEIKHIYAREKLAGEQILIFRHNGQYYLSTEKTELIKQAVPITMNFFTEDNVPQFSFNYKGQIYVYAKNGNYWNRSTAEQYSAEKLEQLPVGELELLRAVIEGRKGRTFTNKKIQNYLQKQNWYKPDPQYTAERLTKQELRNIELIFMVENAKIREGMYEQKTLLP